MFKTIGSLFIVLSLLASPVFAEDSVLLPVRNSSYKPEISLGLLGGIQQFEEESGPALGLEFAFNCLLIDSVRTQISFTRFRDDNDSFSIFSTELSPHYSFELSPSFYAGLGPVLGAATLSFEDDSRTVFSYGAGASARYIFAPGVFVGVDARYTFTNEITAEAGPFSVSLGDLKNARYLAKLGYQF